MDFQKINQILQEENTLLKQENLQLKEHLKKYTAPERSKRFYENHKEEIKIKIKEHLTPEKKKEYNKRYYEKKKTKQNIMNQIPETI